MEALLYLVGLSSYLNPEIEKSRHNLVHELKQKLHASAKASDTLKKDRLAGADGLDCKVESNSALVRLAENPMTAPYVLSLLAEHSDPEVRMAVADNPSAPFSVQSALAEDDHVDVRFRVAENYHIRKGLLEKLADDENPYVSSRASDTLNRLQAA